MPSTFQFERTVDFALDGAEAILAAVPARAGVFALFGRDKGAEPYLTRAANLQRRVRRMLRPPAGATKRLNLSEKVVRIAWTETGSEFESLLTLYHAAAAYFGAAEARRRLRLHSPFCIRFAAENEFPRAYVTNRLTTRALGTTYGPFVSRTAAERALNEMLNLFKLRRCSEQLKPDPMFPGCVYSEMKMCLAPCFKGCTEERYAQEATAVREFLESRGDSLLGKLVAERDAASAAMEFEQAAALHAQMQKVKAAAQMFDELVRPLAALAAVVVQPAAGEAVTLFGVRQGRIGPGQRFSTVGMRHANEESGSTSLFAQPQMPEAVPLDEQGQVGLAASAVTVDQRLRQALEEIPADESGVLSDHLSLLRRWYYKPAKQRAGEIFFIGNETPVRRILRGISRVSVGAGAAAEAAPARIPLDSVPGDHR